MPKKSINLYRDSELSAWENAKAAARREFDGEPTDGRILEELANAYCGLSGGDDE